MAGLILLRLLLPLPLMGEGLLTEPDNLGRETFGDQRVLWQTMQNLVAQAADLIAQAQHMVVFTGAGVSKESGLPTFRDALEGLWARYDPQELAPLEGFRRNPELVWTWYQHRRTLYGDVDPNPGHVAIAELETLV